MNVRTTTVGIVCLILAVLLSAQPIQRGQSVVLSGAAPYGAEQVIAEFATNNKVYECRAPSDVGPYELSVSAISNANPASLTVTAHGFDFPTAATVKPLVMISGLTGNWTPLNGVFVATITGANTLTIAVNSTTFGAVTGTPILTSRAPRTTANVWAIRKFVYDVGNNNIWSGWAVSATGAGATLLPTSSAASYGFACASRGNYSYQ